LPSRPANSEYSGNGDTFASQRQLPRVGSEVFADRPRIVDGDQGYDGNDSDGDDAGAAQIISPQPVDVDILRLLFQREPRWLEIFLRIKALATQAGYPDAIQYFNQQLARDLELAEFFRAAVPHEEGDWESLRENFSMIVKHASAYVETARKNGLEPRKGVELS